MNNYNPKTQNAQTASNQDFSKFCQKSGEWERHNRRNPCPVCGETKECRTNTDTNVIHCRGKNPSNEYRFLKEDKYGFGMYKLEAEIEAFSEAKKEEWLEEKRLEKERREREWQQQLEAGLSPQERDKAIREILNQLSLSDEHKKKLHQRGLSDEQIKNAGYRSVGQWQRLNQGVTPALAGVNRHGTGLVTPASGILIPIPNEKGLWVGYQVRIDNLDDGNKYLWSASEQNRNPRPTVHNRDGELPLGVWGKPSDDGVVGLCESTGIKPYIASLMLGFPFIGAAGANFASSPTALTDALTALEARKIVIYPDAGAVINSHIHQQLINTANFLSERGYDVMFAWWGQAEKSNGDIDEIPEEKIRSIEHLSLIEYQQIEQSNKQMLKASGKGVKSDFRSEENEKLDIKAEVYKLADSDLAQSELDFALNELSGKCSFLPSELRRMYESRLGEIEKETAIGETQNELETLFKLESAKLNIADHLHERLANPISRIAEILGTKPEAFLTTLLPTVASLTKIGTRLELIKATGFYALPILYTGIVGESGTAKSPTQKTILKPLFDLQSEYDDSYQRQYEQWLENCKQAKEDGTSEPPEPKRKELWTDDSTSEAVALIQSNQPDDGFLNWRDELSGLIKDNNKYRGKGSDAEKLLSGRDGSPIKVNRASGKRINCKQSGYSITGGTQPDTLRRQIDFDDPTGHWARFLWCILPLTQNSFPRHASNIDIHELLLGIYKQIKEFPAITYTLSQEATNTYADWYDLLESRKYNEARQGLRTVYSKSKNDTGIIALLLHILNAAIEGRQPNDTIDNDTIKSAISITKFYISQVRLIHSEGDADTGNSLAPLYRKILDLAERKGTITARDVSRSSSSFRGYKTEDIRSLFRELDQMGKAKISGSGTKLKLSSLSSSVGGVSSTTDDKSKIPVEKEFTGNNNTVVSGCTHFSDTDNLDDQKENYKTVISDDKFTKDESTVTTKLTQSHATPDLEDDDKSNDTLPTTNDKTTTESKLSDPTPHLIAGNKILYRDWINKKNKKDSLISPKNERGKIQLENAQIDLFQIRKIWDKEGNLLWEKKND